MLGFWHTWTFWLVLTGIVGVWLAPRHWYGWCITVSNEVLWEAYAWHTHDHALAWMAPVWGILAARGAVISYRKEHAR
jgi:hypothetical protein